ncbi:MAG: hypothetical protein R2774_05425 [Saprospiraceae bacterium]
MEKIILLFLMMVNCYSRPNRVPDNTGTCIETITKNEVVSKDEFLKCINELKIDTMSSEAFIRLTGFWNSKLTTVIDRLEHLSFQPPNIEYYDFKDEPKNVHRLRAVKEILRSLINNQRIKDEVFIKVFENDNSQKIQSFLLCNKTKHSSNLQDFLYTYAIRDSNQYSAQYSLRDQIFDALLLRNDTTKYIDQVLLYYSSKEPKNLDIKIMRYVGSNRIDIISAESKNRLIDVLSEQVFKVSSNEEKSLDNKLLAIDRLLSNRSNLTSRFDSLRKLLNSNRKKAYEQLKYEVETRKNY